MGSRPERGSYGNARGVPDKQARRRRLRESDPRYKAAMEEVRRNQEELDKLAANQAAEAQIKGRPKLSFVKEPEPKETDVSSPVIATPSVLPGRRFAPCHCGDTRDAHESIVGVQGKCTLCGCPYYRPCTAPDPLVSTVEVDTGALGNLLDRAKKSSVKRTVALAGKIELLLEDIRERVEAEEAEEAERRRIEEESREAREAVERLQQELKEAQEKLREVTASPKKRTVTKKTQPVKSAGKFECPTCGDKKDTPQGLGAHRAKKHGYRKGDDDK